VRTLLVCALLTSIAAPAAAQSPSRVHISFGYRYIRARSYSISATPPPGIRSLPVGGEFGVSVRVAPKVSLIGAFGASWSARVPVPDGFGNPPPNGTARFSVFDAMGGVKFSKIGDGPFVALLAGINLPHTSFAGTSKIGDRLNVLDQREGRHFTVRPMAGIDFGSARRVGGRVEAGWDIIPRVDVLSPKPETISHFRVAASATMGVGKPFQPAPRSAHSNPFYVNFIGGLEIKDEGAAAKETIPLGGLSAGLRWPNGSAIEAAVQAEKSQDVDWKLRYLFSQPYTNHSATHRDTLLLLQFRQFDQCARSICLEPFGGAGFTAHHAVDRVVADCGTDIHPKNPCEAVTPYVADDEWQWNLALTAGAAMKVIVSRKVSIGPFVQMSYLGHTRDLFRDNFRGPDGPGPFVASFGVILTIRP
jgi:hypothetical protein